MTSIKALLRLGTLIHVGCLYLFDVISETLKDGKGPTIWNGVVPACFLRKKCAANGDCDSCWAKCGSANQRMHVGAVPSWHVVLRKSQEMCRKWHLFKDFVRQRVREAARSGCWGGS